MPTWRQLNGVAELGNPPKKGEFLQLSVPKALYVKEEISPVHPWLGRPAKYKTDSLNGCFDAALLKVIINIFSCFFLRGKDLGLKAIFSKRLHLPLSLKNDWPTSVFQIWGRLQPLVPVGEHT